ncbi:MAG: Flp family type IVb pilin [Geminicoccaceae bacterium]
MTTFKRFFADESGATAIEYGLIAALVSVAVLAILGTLGGQLRQTFQNISTSLTSAGIAAGGSGD